MLLVGVNNCNLCMFEMLFDNMFGLFKYMLDDCIVVMEFGIFMFDDVCKMCVVVVNVFFVGEVFMCVDDLGVELVCLFV